MSRSDQPQAGDIIPGLAGQIKNLAREQQLALLKDLLKNNVTDALLRVIGKMPAEQQQALASRLQQATREPAITEETEISLRGYSRKSCMLAVRYTVAGRDFESFMLDISPAGAFIETDADVLEGQPIHLDFSLPHIPNRVTLNGVILWKGTLGIGVKFTDPTPEQLKRISAYVETREAL